MSALAPDSGMEADIAESPGCAEMAERFANQECHLLSMLLSRA
jgi:hypothetical protein